MKATATFHDLYFGPVPVRLAPVGRRGPFVWVAPDHCVNTGYRPVPAARAVRNAIADRRYSDVREG